MYRIFYFLLLSVFVSCNIEKRVAERKLLVNFKDANIIQTSLKEVKYEPLYYRQDSITKYRATEIGRDSGNISNATFFYTKLYKSLSKLDQELNQTVVVTAKSKRKKRKLISFFESDPNVVFVQENELQKLNYYPNDPYFSSMWNLSKINCSDAWSLSEGDNIVIAVIDDGTVLSHTDIAQNLWRGPNGEAGYDLNGNNNLYPNGTIHGTHVAGTAAATGNNDFGIIGVAPKAKIMTLKVFPNADDIKCARAFAAAIQRGANVINNSWGPRQRRVTNPELSRVIDIAYQRNISVVFAAGNANDDVMYYAPANHPRVIAVGSTNEIDNRSSFSNYGTQISVTAPGNNILSLNGSNGFITSSGTSMAAPHVSGLIALIKKANPSLTAEQIKLLIENNAKTITTDKPMGFGRIDVYKTVYQAIVSQRHTIGMNLICRIVDHDQFSSNEICDYNIPFSITILPDGQINTGELVVPKCDNEVWAKVFYSYTMDINRTFQFSGVLNLYDDDNFQGSQTFNIRIPFQQTGNIVTGFLDDGEDEDKIDYRFFVNLFQ